MDNDQPKVPSTTLHDLVAAAKELYADHEHNPDLEHAERLANEFVEVVPEPYIVPLNALAGGTPSVFYESRRPKL